MEKVRKSPKEKKVRKPKWTKNDSELTALALPTTVWYVLFCFLQCLDWLSLLRITKLQAEEVLFTM